MMSVTGVRLVDVYDSALLADFFRAYPLVSSSPDVIHHYDRRKHAHFYTLQLSAFSVLVSYVLDSAVCFHTSEERSHCAVTLVWQHQHGVAGGMKRDLFIVEAESWGWQLCLHTGSTGFNREVLLKAMHQQDYASDEGCLNRDGQAIATPEEGDVFRLFRLPWYEPWAREVQL